MTNTFNAWKRNASGIAYKVGVVTAANKVLADTKAFRLYGRGCYVTERDAETARIQDR